MKNIFGIVVISLVTSIATYTFATRYIHSDPVQLIGDAPTQSSDLHYANYTDASPSPDGGYVNLEEAAEKATRAVVHIKTETKARVARYQNPFGDDFFDQFFGQRYYQQMPQQSSGSGVIISADGYIVTNNHVVDGADEVTVILNNKRSLKAKLMGHDASTDLALLKVNEDNLPFIPYGNSDDVKLGQWVLAVGYPLTLESTVTAGIVSAKYRNIGINKRQDASAPVESFIQTDAAVNPGNSGGALVNSRGELVGINSAIASPTGSYAGYSFAIPSNIVKKVVSDLMKFGNVQRAYLGVGYIDMKNATPEQMSAYNLDKIDGIYISQIYDGSSAASAGLKEGDIITKIAGKDIRTGPQMMELVAQYRPGDKIDIHFLRGGKEYKTTADLKNRLGTTDIVKNDAATQLGATLRELTKTEAQRYRLSGGIVVSEIKAGGAIARQSRMKRNFIITQVNDKDVKTLNDIEKSIDGEDGPIQVGGIYPGYQGFYYYQINLK